jgi:hypothetical protein
MAQFPVVVENMLDAKETLDGKLRIAINQFTSSCAEQMSYDLRDNTSKNINGDGIQSGAERFRETANKVLTLVQQKIEEYIGDPRTTDILVNAILVC